MILGCFQYLILALFAIISAMSVKTIVVCFVCVSNTCRSPMAEYLLRHKINSVNQSGVEIRSRALTDAYEKPGSPASPQGVEVS